MKKSILAILATIPFLVCCNKNSKGFVDPFPDDPYDKIKIGFNFDEKEKIKRTLTTQESELLDKTDKNLDAINLLLTKENGSIHERDYTRAFAGVHGAGYDSSNMMYDEDFESFYQEADPEHEPEALLERRKTTSNVKSTYDYSYGQNKTIANFHTFRYLANRKTEAPTTEYTYEETTKAGVDPAVTIERKYEVIAGQEDSPVSAFIIAKEEEDLHVPLHFSQSEYVFKPSSSDPIAGVNEEGNVVIIREEHDPSGEYELPDGRKYKMAKNTLRVSQLTKESDARVSGDYYLVKSARVYTETAITSDVIQPNVPITFLDNPIVVNYKEEFHNFSTDDVAETSEEIIKEVEIIE